MIDGALHPELIADSTAYLLFFVTVAEPEDAADNQRARERAYLESAGLEGNDVEAAVSIVARFKAQHDDLAKQYNDSGPTGGILKRIT